jgi:hypothetical protein
MTDRNELVDETRVDWLDTDTLDRMLAGGIHPEDAPPGYAGVAGVLLAVAEAGGDRDLVHEPAHVALAIELVQQRSPVPHPLDRRSRRPSMGARSRRHRGKIGALVVVGAMVGSTGLAAAGVLPDTAQDAFAHVLGKVGITVPAGNDHPASSGEELSGAGTTPDAAHPAPKGAETSSVASGGRSQAGQHGSAGNAGRGHGATPRHTPNGKGTADAPGKSAGSPGTSTADEASQGRSRPGPEERSVTPSVRPTPSAHSSH